MHHRATSRGAGAAHSDGVGWPVPHLELGARGGCYGGRSVAPPYLKMGKKITVDSASLVNKALEVIEAHFLFGLPYEAVNVVVHPQSVVHAFVEFVDGPVLAQVGFPTTELPILYALTHPERVTDRAAQLYDPVAARARIF